jgi:sugar phosphate isomerase/epimerase
VSKRQFGVSTYLHHGQRLSREHLLEIAAHGFETIELFATSTHFDYENPSAVGNLQQWLAEAGLTLHSVHAPVAKGYLGGQLVGPMSLASRDVAARAQAVAAARQAIQIARRIPVAVVVVHLGVPRTDAAASADARASARRSIEELHETAEPLGVQIAVEVIQNELSRAGSLVHFVDDDLEGVDDRPVGVCLDFGHAHIDGDLIEAIEAVSEHFTLAHLHDNRGRGDDHLVPYDGSIDWPSALIAVQKVGYEGPLIFELGAHGSPKDTLARARKARQRMEQFFAS